MELKDIKGIGNKTLAQLNDAGIYTISDLIHTFPKTYNIYEINNKGYLRKQPLAH